VIHAERFRSGADDDDDGDDDVAMCGCRFTTECHLETDGEVTCFGCPEGYTGRRCERCAEGYEGDPTEPGGSCRFTGYFLLRGPDIEIREIDSAGCAESNAVFQ